MTELLSHIDTPSDAELISRVRGGDVAAYGELFSRHVDAANRLARQLVRGPDADDLVSEAFAKVLQVVQGGGGPDVAFRAYLLTSVRRLHVDKIRSGSRLQTTDDLTPFDPGIPFQDTAVAGFESGAAAKAFASLPERWQLVLWHLEVEGQKPAEIAPLLGMSANSVSALAYRAREGLRQAFLTMHLADISDTNCRWVNEHLGAYVRNGLSKRDATKVRGHLDECRRCTATYLELTEVNSNLSGIIAPLLLGAAATGYLASTGGAVGTAGLLGVVGRVRDTVMANAGAATAGAVAAGVAAAAVVGISLTTGKSDNTTTGADSPIRAASSAPASPGAGPSARKSKRTSPSAAASASAAGPTSALTPVPVPGALVPQAPGQTAQPGPGDPGTAGPTAAPGDGSTDNPGNGPSDNPSGNPSGDPSGNPSGNPSQGPTDNPTDNPTGGPSQGPTDQPTATDTPAPGPVAADVSVEADFGPTGTSATLTVRGSSTLPPTLDIALTSTPGGIAFASGGNCATASTTLVHCSLLGGSGGDAVARTSSVTAAADGPFVATLFFTIPADQPDTDVNLAVSVPDGYADPDLSNNTGSYHYERPVNLPEAPLVMRDLSPQSATPDADGRYQVTGHVDGIPTTVQQLTFDLGGDAAFDPSTPDCTVVDAHQATCPTNGTGSLDPHFVLTTAADPPLGISITVRVPDGYVDTSGTGGQNGTEDNSAGASLQPRPAPPAPTADVSVSNLRPDPATPEGDGTYRLVADVAGFPTDPAAPSPDAVYTLDGKATLVGTGTEGCTLSGPDPTSGQDAAPGPDAAKQTLTCTDPQSGTLVVQVAADDNTGTTPVGLSVAALTGYDDPDSTNNRAGTTLGAGQFADLGVELPQTVHEDGNDPAANRFTLPTTVTGLPAGTTEVVLSESGAGSFVNGEGCSAGADVTSVTCTVADTSSGSVVVSPVLAYDGPDPIDVTVTAVTPDGYVDPTPGTPASDSTTLQPEAVDALTVGATLSAPDKDQHTGQLTVTVSGAADGHPLTLTVQGKNEHSVGIRLTGVVSGPCTTTGDQGATCTAAGTYVFAVDVPPGLLSGKVTVEDGVHQAATATFDGPDAELGLLIPKNTPAVAGDALARVTRHATTAPGDALPKAIQRETERRTAQPKPRSHAAQHRHGGHPKAHKHGGHGLFEALRHGHHRHAAKHRNHGGPGHGHGGNAVRMMLGGLLAGLTR